MTHPAWQRAAASIREGCENQVRFSHVPGDFHLLRKDGVTQLLEGPASDPDLAFCFTPKAIERLAAVESDEVSDFALELFDTILSEDPDEQVGLRVVSGFTRLMFRGYVGLLFKSGPSVLAYGKKRGVSNVSSLRKLIKQNRASDPRWAQV